MDALDYGEWRHSKSHPGLRVSSRGYVQILKRGGFWCRPYLPLPNACGYCIVVHQGAHLRVHNIIATEFLGLCPDGCTVDHIDRNRSNNSIENLRWATKELQSENQAVKRTRVDSVDEGDGPLDEEFRTSVGNLSVSQYGRLLNNLTGKRYTPKPKSTGDYAMVCVDRQHYMVHHLVADAWPEIVGMKVDDKTTIDHMNRDKTNNAASNLRWASLSEQRLNQDRKPSAETNRVALDWVAVDVAAPDAQEWTKYPSMTLAAEAIRSVTGGNVTHSQISLIVRNSPSGYVAKRGVFKGWKIRQHRIGKLAPSDLKMQKTRTSLTAANPRRRVSFRPPGSHEWTSCESCLGAAKYIEKHYGNKFSSSSISRTVTAYPEGHTMTAKQNAGWAFKLG